MDHDYSKDSGFTDILNSSSAMNQSLLDITQEDDLSDSSEKENDRENDKPQENDARKELTKKSGGKVAIWGSGRGAKQQKIDHKAAEILIDYVKASSGLFNDTTTKKKSVWASIGEKMEYYFNYDLGPNPGLKCESKWDSLNRAVKKHELKSTTGSGSDVLMNEPPLYKEILAAQGEAHHIKPSFIGDSGLAKQDPTKYALKPSGSKGKFKPNGEPQSQSEEESSEDDYVKKASKRIRPSKNSNLQNLIAQNKLNEEKKEARALEKEKKREQERARKEELSEKRHKDKMEHGDKFLALMEKLVAPKKRRRDSSD